MASVDHQIRVEVFREACRDEGRFVDRLLDARSNVVPDDNSTAFDWRTYNHIVPLVRKSLQWMPDGSFKDAAANALGLTDDGETDLDRTWNLTRRRKEYLAVHGDISERTLIRHELAGLDLLAETFEKVQNDFIKSWVEPATGREVIELRSQVKALERDVERMSKVMAMLASELGLWDRDWRPEDINVDEREFFSMSVQYGMKHSAGSKARGLRR